MTEAERAELASQRHTELLDLVTKTHNGVESVKAEVGELSTNFALHEKDDEHVHNGHANRLSSLEEAATATGQHKIIRLEEELAKSQAEKKKGEDRWKDLGWKVIAAVVLMIVSAGMGVFFGH